MDWITTSQYNENGWSNGGFDTKKDKWYANIHLTTGENFYFEDISHKKVALWLQTKRIQFNLK